jgi:hypothetical protein
LEDIDRIIKRKGNYSNTEVLTWLEQVCVVFSYAPDKLKLEYYKLCYALRNTLTHLQLKFLKYPFSLDSRSAGYLTFLLDFKSLTHLHMHNDLQHGDNNISLGLIISSCPHFIDLYMTSQHPIIQSSSSMDSLLLPADKTVVQSANHLKVINLRVHYVDIYQLLKCIPPKA